MALSHLPDRHCLPQIPIAEFPPCFFKEKTDIAPQIAEHLIHLLERHGAGCPASLRIPSAMCLSGFYRRSVLDVLEGLFELKKQRYEYVMNGLDAGIILHDPLCRKKPEKKVPLLAHAWNSLSRSEGETES